MKTLRAFAIASLGLLAAYHALRVVAAQCSGQPCDAFIPISLLLPLLIVVTVALTGLLAVTAAKRRASVARDPAIRNGHYLWIGFLTAAWVVGVLGPLASLAIFRDNPDPFVGIASLLAAVLPLSVLVYTFIFRVGDPLPFTYGRR